MTGMLAAKAMFLAALLALVAYVSTLPYDSTALKEAWTAQELSKTLNSVSKTELCLGNPSVCIDESHLRMLRDGFKLRTQDNGWYSNSFIHTHQDGNMRIVDDGKYRTTYKMLPN